MKLLTILLALTFFLITQEPPNPFRQAKIILTNGAVIEAEIAQEDSYAVLYKLNGKLVWLQRTNIKEIIRIPACPLKLSSSPTLRGLRLDMTIDQVISVYPKLRKDDALTGISRADEFGYSFVSMNAPFYVLLDPLRSERLKGVNDISVEFLDGKATRISVEYDKSITWDSPEQFYKSAAEGLGVSEAWIKDQRGGHASVECADFIVEVRSFSRTSISLSIPAAAGILEQRRTEAAKKKRQTFKP